jgi:hypothetical protein
MYRTGVRRIAANKELPFLYTNKWFSSGSSETRSPLGNLIVDPGRRTRFYYSMTIKAKHNETLRLNYIYTEQTLIDFLFLPLHAQLMFRSLSLSLLLNNTILGFAVAPQQKGCVCVHISRQISGCTPCVKLGKGNLEWRVRVENTYTRVY